MKIIKYKIVKNMNNRHNNNMINNNKKEIKVYQLIIHNLKMILLIAIKIVNK
jgi:hypothetical protein